MQSQTFIFLFMFICWPDKRNRTDIIVMKYDGHMVYLLKTPVIYLINNKFRGINLSVLNYCSNFATLFGVTADNGRVAGHVALGDKQI